MGSTFTSSLPAPTTASLAQMIDSGLLTIDNIVVERDHPVAAEIQRFIREYTNSEKNRK